MGSLRRSPLDLRNYLLWSSQITQEHGSVAEFVRQEKLHWEISNSAAVQSNALFEHPNDIKVIRNDWPYTLMRDITHLVVWSKTRVEGVPETGLPTPEATRAIEAWLDTTLGPKLGCRRGKSLQWFKQTAQWQSVQALEHIHVLVRGVADGKTEMLTGQKADQIGSQVALRAGELASTKGKK